MFLHEKDFHSDEDITDIPFTTTKELNNIKDQDCTVILVGIVESIEDPRLFGETKKEKKRWRFYVNNNEGQRIQIAVWNHEIERLKNKIFLGYKKQPKTQYNLGTTEFELNINQNTVVHCIPLSMDGVIFQREVPLIELKDIANTTGYIKIEGYVRSPFQKIEKFKDESKEYALASISDGVYNLEVRVDNFSKLDILKSYKRGFSLELSGYLRTRLGNKIYLSVSSADDIKNIDLPEISIKTILSGNRPIEKRKIEDGCNDATSNKLNKTI